MNNKIVYLISSILVLSIMINVSLCCFIHSYSSEMNTKYQELYNEHEELKMETRNFIEFLDNTVMDESDFAEYMIGQYLGSSRLVDLIGYSR